jgi:hypothetical protein
MDWACSVLYVCVCVCVCVCMYIHIHSRKCRQQFWFGMTDYSTYYYVSKHSRFYNTKPELSHHHVIFMSDFKLPAPHNMISHETDRHSLIHNLSRFPTYTHTTNLCLLTNTHTHLLLSLRFEEAAGSVEGHYEARLLPLSAPRQKRCSGGGTRSSERGL